MAKFTKQAIMNCLLELLNTKQLDKITVKDICEICEINRNTFYYYFQDIYEEPIDENNNFSIEISRINREITFEGNGNKVYAHIQISIKGRARDNSGDLIEDSVEIYDKEQLMSECLTKKFQKMAQASQGKDLFNTYYELSTKNRKLWKAYQDNYSKYVQNLELKINVSLNCN